MNLLLESEIMFRLEDNLFVGKIWRRLPPLVGAQGNLTNVSQLTIWDLSIHMSYYVISWPHLPLKQSICWIFVKYHMTLLLNQHLSLYLGLTCTRVKRPEGLQGAQLVKYLDNVCWILVKYLLKIGPIFAEYKSNYYLQRDTGISHRSTMFVVLKTQ